MSFLPAESVATTDRPVAALVELIAIELERDGFEIVDRKDRAVLARAGGREFMIGVACP